jgi:signal transduction histidine kinase
VEGGLAIQAAERNKTLPGVIPRGAGNAATGGRNDSGPRFFAPLGIGGRVLKGGGSALALCAALISPIPVWAQEMSKVPVPGGLSLGTWEVIQLAVFAGITGAAMLSAIWLIRERARTAAENLELRGRMSETATALQRAESLLNLNDQRVVVWMNEDRKPEVVGALPAETGVPDERGAFLAFGRWLAPQSAADLERALTALREHGATFDIVVETQNGTLLEAQGRKSALSRVLRFASLSEPRKEHARLRLEHQLVSSERDMLLGLANALAMPMWMRRPDGKLRWVNHAYAAAVEAGSPHSAVEEGKEFLGTPAREAISRQQKIDAAFAQKLSTVVGGDRRVYAVTDHATPEGSAGIAVDVSDTESVREQYERMARSHADTLDQLNTAIAIFDSECKLRFFNQAFQKLWELDVGFLESAPEHALVLDRLRSEGKLAEQPEWRRWKENLLDAYRAVESQEHWWHLPDGRTVRVVANPQANGGVTWIFENLTEQIDLESRYKTAVRVQGETLDNLAEGVAVFGPDGRIRLSNPAFARLWGLDATQTEPGTHISKIRDNCAARAKESPWNDFVAAATGFDEERRDKQGQVELVDGLILRYAVIHLPNGQAMITFVDVTDSVNVERALKDKNEALQRADQLKNDFVQHVSYELRSPLTNISGFAELLAMETTGPLNQRQREYVDHIGSSSAVLHTIVNDILDLATVDAGIMELEIGEVPVRRMVEDAAELVGERLREHDIRLDIDSAGAPDSFHADEQRVRQVLFNLLNNAANFAPEGSTIQLTARGADGGVEFSVHDDGPGMPDEVLETVFKRFEPRPSRGRRRGAGLGLSIVKSFVELHGGSVEIKTGAETGTTVICRFPAAPDGIRAAAE